MASSGIKWKHLIISLSITPVILIAPSYLPSMLSALVYIGLTAFLIVGIIAAGILFFNEQFRSPRRQKIVSSWAGLILGTMISIFPIIRISFHLEAEKEKRTKEFGNEQIAVIDKLYRIKGKYPLNYTLPGKSRIYPIQYSSDGDNFALQFNTRMGTYWYVCADGDYLRFKNNSKDKSFWWFED